MINEEGESNACWDMQWSSVCGVVVDRGNDARCMGAAVMHAGIVADDLPLFADVMYLNVSLAGMHNELAARVLAIGFLAALYDACSGDDTGSMLDICNELIATFMHAWADDDTEEGDGIMLMERHNLRINWLPFTRDEARWLAFGTRVSVDSLPAFCCAVRARDNNDAFDPDSNTSLTLVHPPQP